MRRAALFLSLALVVVGCGDDDATTTAPGGGGTLTGDAVLEELGTRCGDGDYVACDVLYQASPVGSQYEAFADSCGGEGVPDEAFCAYAHGVEIDLGDLRDGCAAGDMLACDMLYIYSPFDSPEEAFGDECAGRGDPGLSCAVAYGWTP
jgi:hypothetical protein